MACITFGITLTFSVNLYSICGFAVGTTFGGSTDYSTLTGSVRLTIQLRYSLFRDDYQFGLID